jgi:hypothetical protein
VTATLLLTLAASAPTGAQQAGGNGGSHSYSAASGVPMTPVTATGGRCIDTRGTTMDGVQYKVSSREYGGEVAEASVYGPGFDGSRTDMAPRLTAEADVSQRTVTFTIPGAAQGDRPSDLEIVPVGDQLVVNERGAGFQVNESADGRQIDVTGNGVKNTVVMGPHGGDRIHAFVNHQAGDAPYQAGQSVLEMPSDGRGQAMAHVAMENRPGYYNTVTSGCERPSAKDNCPRPYGGVGDTQGTTNGAVRYTVSNDGYSESAEAQVFADPAAAQRYSASYQDAPAPLLTVEGSVAGRELKFAAPNGARQDPHYLAVQFVGGRLHLSPPQAQGFETRASDDQRTVTIVGNGVQSTVAVSDDGDGRVDAYLNQKPGEVKYQPDESILELPTSLNGPAVFRVAGGDEQQAHFYNVETGCKTSG